MKHAERILQEHHITLIRKPYYGIKAEGKEFDIRLCMARYGENAFPAELPEKEYQEKRVLNHISDSVAGCLKECDMSLSDVAFQHLVVHLYIAMKRIQQGCYVPINPEQKNLLKERKEYGVARRIVERIGEQSGIDFPDSEIGYISIHLAGKMTYGDEGEAGNLVISPDILDVAEKMLQIVYETFRYDFRDDLELKVSLCQHLVPLTVRLKYGMVMSNPIEASIKEDFSMAYAMAVSACSVINETFHTELNEAELAYFALPFQLAFERQKTQVCKKNVLLVCSSGKGSAQLLKYKYQKEFGEYINRIETCEANKIPQMDFKDIDYVFSTVPITARIPVPIIQVGYFLKAEDYKNVKRTLSGFHTTKDGIRKYYPEQLFFPHMKAACKEDILWQLSVCACENEENARALYDSIMLREKMAQTAFGNSAAMPHPHQAMSLETKVCVAVLDEPVSWNQTAVSVVFLVLIEKGKNKNLQKFYKVTSRFLLEEQYIKELIKKRNYSEFIKTLSMIEKEVEESYG